MIWQKYVTMLQVIYHNTTFYCGFANKAPTKSPTVSELLGFPEEKAAIFFFTNFVLQTKMPTPNDDI